VVVFVKNGVTTGWRDAVADHDSVGNPVSATITSEVQDLVIKYDVINRSLSSVPPPSLTAGWTNIIADTPDGDPGGGLWMSLRASSVDVPGNPSTVCDSEDESYSSICAIAIQELTPTFFSLTNVLEAEVHDGRLEASLALQVDIV
jgi:hypothetical protein